MNSSESIIEKLMLVPVDIYEKIIKECDNVERSEISNHNESTTDIPISMNTIGNNIDKSSLENDSEMSLNSKSVSPENMELIRNSRESNQDLQQQKEVISSKENTSVSKPIENKNVVNDCPPTSENSILRIKPYLCNSCSKRYATPFTLKRHWNNKHGPNQQKPTFSSKKNVNDQSKLVQNWNKLWNQTYLLEKGK